MRLIFEHPWVAATIVSSIGAGFLWVGLRESLMMRVKIGLSLLLLAVIVFTVGTLVVTPTEHARKVVIGFVDAVADGEVSRAASFLSDEVILVDDWTGDTGIGVSSVRESLIELHKRHTLKHNTVLRFEPFEREGDVLVELSLLTRVSGIGTVPSRWRLLIKPTDGGDWKLYSIDAIEIMGRSFR